MDACGGFAWNRIRVERLSRASFACSVYIRCVTEDGGNGNFLPFLIIISTEASATLSGSSVLNWISVPNCCLMEHRFTAHV